jgi:glycosyltransferase involved in cell wall biosynthesis
MTLLSAIILTRNEEHSIKECISQLLFCDEILVIDDESTDDTRNIATSCGAKVISHTLDSNFAAQRNFGELSAQGKWILHIDADERVSKELANEIIQIVNDPLLSFSGFYIRRVDSLFGKKLWHGEFGETKLLRLMRKGSGVWKPSDTARRSSATG